MNLLWATWINPSPRITSMESARLYPSLCFLEGTNISEGRGTAYTVSGIWSPFLDNELLLK